MIASLVGPMRLPQSPARYVIERGDWKAAAELAGPPEQVRLCGWR